MRFLLIALIRLYRALVSPHLAGACRHSPSCSVYALDAIDRHGPWRGGRMVAKRLMRCHPLGTSGYDPVP